MTDTTHVTPLVNSWAVSTCRGPPFSPPRVETHSRDEVSSGSLLYEGSRFGEPYSTVGKREILGMVWVRGLDLRKPYLAYRRRRGTTFQCSKCKSFYQSPSPSLVLRRPSKIQLLRDSHPVRREDQGPDDNIKIIKRPKPVPVKGPERSTGSSGSNDG